MDLETVTLEDALRLLSLPRVVGVDPDNGEEITAQNGRYGPYLKKRHRLSVAGRPRTRCSTSRWSEALKIYAEPKRRGAGAAAPPLRELGADPAGGKPMVIKDGRFGPYVTDGETNASLRKGDEVQSITDERAAELLADRRAAGPAKGRGARPPPRRPPRRRPPRRRPPRARPRRRRQPRRPPRRRPRRPRRRRRTAKKTAAKKTAAKKAPATKVVAETSG